MEIENLEEEFNAMLEAIPKSYTGNDRVLFYTNEAEKKIYDEIAPNVKKVKVSTK